MKKCLLIIDVQEAMFCSDEVRLFNEVQVVKNIKKLIQTAREREIAIVYIQHTENDGLYKKNQKSWEIYHEIAPFKNDIVVEKTSWDSFLNTELRHELEKLDVKEIIVAGMQTEFCLDTSIRSGYEKKYSLVVAKDAHSTFDSNVLTGKQIIEHHNNIWNDRFARLKNTEEIIDELSNSNLKNCEYAESFNADISYEIGGFELLDRVEKLWYELNSYHENNSKYFKNQFASFDFDMRRKSFKEKNIWIKMVIDNTTKLDLGYIVVSIDNNNIGEIESLYLKPDLRGLGVGEIIMRDAISWINSNKAKKITIGVAYGNERAFKFYEKFGFYPRVTLLGEI